VLGFSRLESSMAKTKISSTDLVWIFHEESQAFDDFPLHWISIAIVPTAALRQSKNDSKRCTLWSVKRSSSAGFGGEQ
jgi:hypothetical protein